MRLPKGRPMGRGKFHFQLKYSGKKPSRVDFRTEKPYNGRMIYLKDFRQGRLLYEALDSDIRLGILEELLEKGELNLAYFARRFSVSNGAITAHVKKLHSAGLIDISTSSGVRGTQKICRLTADRIIVDLVTRPQEDGKVDSAVLEIGQYVDYEIHPTCGIATGDGILGGFDNVSSFTYPERVNAGILWLGWGYVEYLVPNFLKEGKLQALQFTMELASEAPGYAAIYPSDIHFSVNGVTLGFYTSKGEYNDRAGTAAPPWWYGNLGQYGKKVTVSVEREGSYINGVQVSSVSVADLNIAAGEQIRFRIFVPENAVNRGGFTLFGKGFGDYGEGITVRFVHAEE